MLEHVEEGLIGQRVEIDKMQCGFMLGCGTTDAIFIAWRDYPHAVSICTIFHIIVVKLKSPFSETLSQYPGSDKLDYWVKHVTIYC